MALTVDTATQAGQIAAEIVQLQAALAAAQQAVSLNVVLQNYTATGYLSGQTMPLACNVPMSVTDSATILNALATIYQNNITALTAQLAAM